MQDIFWLLHWYCQAFLLSCSKCNTFGLSDCWSHKTDKFRLYSMVYFRRMVLNIPAKTFNLLRSSEASVSFQVFLYAWAQNNCFNVTSTVCPISIIVARYGVSLKSIPWGLSGQSSLQKSQKWYRSSGIWSLYNCSISSRCFESTADSGLALGSSVRGFFTSLLPVPDSWKNVLWEKQLFKLALYIELYCNIFKVVSDMFYSTTFL